MSSAARRVNQLLGVAGGQAAAPAAQVTERWGAPRHAPKEASLLATSLLSPSAKARARILAGLGPADFLLP